MPGPISDSRDPEFGTGQAAQEVHDAICEVASRIDRLLGPRLLHIRDVVRGNDGPAHQLVFTERELRVARFALRRAGNSI